MVDARLTNKNPNDLYDAALKPFVDLVKKYFDEKTTPCGKEKLWALLKKGDQMSVRQYLLS